MEIIERLKRDHRLLRAKLDVLESALDMGGETWFVVRELCHSLIVQLRRHMRREEEAIIGAKDAIGSNVLSRVEAEHMEDPQQLNRVYELFLDGPQQPFENLRIKLWPIIRRLRDHLDNEECNLYPLLEKGILVGAATAHEPARKLSETMTVNRVLRDHPETQTIFSQFLINSHVEGCDFLDEVAWRHGMESRDLLDHLERMIH